MGHFLGAPEFAKLGYNMRQLGYKPSTIVIDIYIDYMVITNWVFQVAPQSYIQVIELHGLYKPTYVL